MDQKGIDNVKKLALTLVEVVNVGVNWADKGASGYAELLRLSDEVMQLPGLEYGKLDDEFKDMSADEILELQNAMVAKLDLPDAKALPVASKSLAVAARAGMLAKEIANLVEEAKKLKAE